MADTISQCEFDSEEITNFLIIFDEWIRKTDGADSATVVKSILKLYEAGIKRECSLEEVLEFPNENELDKMLGYISMAKKIVRIWVYFFTNKKIWDALKILLYNGVEVKLNPFDWSSKIKNDYIYWIFFTELREK